MAMTQITELLTKKPFGRALPIGYRQGGVVSDLMETAYPEDRVTYKVISQADYLRELDTSGHLINDTTYYPDKLKKVPKTNKIS